MTNPQGPNTAILTYFITAQQLYEMRTHLPLPPFISEGDPKVDPNRGWHAALSRLVSTVSVHGGSSLDGREQIFVEFLDGTPGRLFDLDDKVEVHMTPYVYLDYPERRRWSCRR
ncbi:MAG: hypothetical protein ACLQGN_03355 [Mycobacterium sp.]|uniref:hypothetical protein n=1 Tax=Mycobacterium sp. TaxID=1785 RepID=UPI003F97A554